MASKYIGARDLMKQNGYSVADILGMITSGKPAAYYHDGRKIANIYFQKEYDTYRGGTIAEYMLGDEIFKTSINGGKVLDWLWNNRSDVYAFPFLDKDAFRLGLSVHERQRIAKDTMFLVEDLGILAPTNNTSILNLENNGIQDDNDEIKTNSKTKYLKIIAMLLENHESSLPLEGRNSCGIWKRKLQTAGYPLDDKTIRKVLKEIKDVADKKKAGITGIPV